MGSRDLSGGNNGGELFGKEREYAKGKHWSARGKGSRRTTVFKEYTSLVHVHNRLTLREEYGSGEIPRNSRS